MTRLRSHALAFFALVLGACASSATPAPAYPVPEDPPLEETDLAQHLEPPADDAASESVESDPE